ncbi:MULTISPECIES: MmyB family transcriptional regulator [Streptomyces]|uniref:MmyB family transcriptional regulator n=1 Tax=Streptomyces TaxID=1883 RepID=UPI001CCEA523|nr:MULTISPECIES: hypothetical protein [Streptomyces]UBI41062.1 hypothetical protein K7I03_11015 [Streptomyces mobaraensis]
MADSLSHCRSDTVPPLSRRGPRYRARSRRPSPTSAVGELSIADEDFRRWWADQNVHRHTHGSKHFHHPVVGPLTLKYESLTLPADPDQRLSVYTAEERSASEETLRLLDAWTRRPRARESGQRPATTEARGA